MITKRSLIEEFLEVLGEIDNEIEYCELEKCKIITEEGEKVQKRGQRIPQALLKKTRVHLSKLEKRKIIRKSRSDWRNPIRSLEKPDKGIRLVSSSIALNDLVEKDPYTIAEIRDVIRTTQDARWFTVVNFKTAVYNIVIEEEDKFKTAFEFEGTMYEWNFMVMGFKNLPQILQQIINRMFEDIRKKGVMVYMWTTL